MELSNGFMSSMAETERHIAPRAPRKRPLVYKCRSGPFGLYRRETETAPQFGKSAFGTRSRRKHWKARSSTSCMILLLTVPNTQSVPPLTRCQLRELCEWRRRWRSCRVCCERSALPANGAVFGPSTGGLGPPEHRAGKPGRSRPGGSAE